MNRNKFKNWNLVTRVLFYFGFISVGIVGCQFSLAAQNQGTTLTTTTPNAWYAYYYDANNVLKYIETLEDVKDRSIKPYFGDVPTLPPANLKPEDSTTKHVQILGGTNANVAVYYGLTCFTGKLIKLAVEDLAGVSREIATLASIKGTGDCRCNCTSQGGVCVCPPPCR